MHIAFDSRNTRPQKACYSSIDRISSDRNREDTMIRTAIPGWKRRLLALAVAIYAGAFSGTQAAAQNEPMEQKLMAIKQAQAANKQRLAQYTWLETETI